MMRKPKFMIIMEALWQGHEIDFNGYKMVMVDTDNGPACAIKAVSSLRGEILLGTHLTLDGFLAWCDSMSDEDVFGLSADIALNKALNRGPRRNEPNSHVADPCEDV